MGWKEEIEDAINEAAARGFEAGRCDVLDRVGNQLGIIQHTPIAISAAIASLRAAHRQTPAECFAVAITEALDIPAGVEWTVAQRQATETIRSLKAAAPCSLADVRRAVREEMRAAGQPAAAAAPAPVGVWRPARTTDIMSPCRLRRAGVEGELLEVSRDVEFQTGDTLVSLKIDTGMGNYGKWEFRFGHRSSDLQGESGWLFPGVEIWVPAAAVRPVPTLQPSPLRTALAAVREPSSIEAINRALVEGSALIGQSGVVAAGPIERMARESAAQREVSVAVMRSMCGEPAPSPRPFRVGDRVRVNRSTAYGPAGTEFTIGWVDSDDTCRANGGEWVHITWLTLVSPAPGEEG